MSYVKLTKAGNGNFDLPVVSSRANLSGVFEENETGGRVSMADSTPDERATYGWMEELLQEPLFDTRVERLQLDARQITSPTEVTSFYIIVDLPLPEAQLRVENAIKNRYLESILAGTTTLDGIDVPTENGAADNYMLDQWGVDKLYQTAPVVETDLHGDLVQLNAAKLDNACSAIFGHRSAARGTAADKIVSTRNAVTINELRLILADIDTGWPPSPSPV